MSTPIVVELGPARCADVDSRVEAEFARSTSRPAGPVTKDGVRAWVDKLEVSESRKNAVGRQLIAEYKQCRAGTIQPREPAPAAKATS